MGGTEQLKPVLFKGQLQLMPTETAQSRGKRSPKSSFHAEHAGLGEDPGVIPESTAIRFVTSVWIFPLVKWSILRFSELWGSNVTAHASVSDTMLGTVIASNNGGSASKG